MRNLFTQLLNFAKANELPSNLLSICFQYAIILLPNTYLTRRRDVLETYSTRTRTILTPYLLRTVSVPSPYPLRSVPPRRLHSSYSVPGSRTDVGIIH